ncbi:MAG: hypothetical protein COV67_07065 [Nitrospinae bacterium CG11_big_fil_rev_8_21_14_0_20_56_8]|nr:MAG: hypothetical protein COV67_07065 [Nitrospinae bacterium CG11_big_fil_rev_8_21_14_0_20_56_8]
MQIKCNGCQKTITIPDDKLPRGQAFNITCPGCKSKIRVDQHLNAPAPEAEPAVASAPPPAPAKAEAPEKTIDTPKLTITQEESEEDQELVIYDEHDRIALVLDEKNKDAWVHNLEEKGFKIQFARTPEQAVYKMRFTQFHLVALHETFGNVPLDKSALYQSLIELPMVTRRHIFVALAGPGMKTLNNMQAFNLSVNVVINDKDFDKLGDILKKSIAENDTFYKVFKETLKALGKA